MKRKNREITGLAVLAVFVIFFFACGNSRPAVRSVNEKGAQETGVPPGNIDAEKFASEYPLVGRDNVFVFRNARETVDILANGTGVVFMGFKECPWCQTYAVFLNDVARETGINRIFYCDIREDRQENTESYQKITGILSGLLQYDDEGRPRVYVPDVTIIDSGRIIGRDYETSKDTLGYEEPREYWTSERVNALKEKLRESMKGISRSCSSCDF